VTHFVETAHDSALDERPETFNGVRMNRAYYMLADGMVNRLVREAMPQGLVAGESIGAKQADFGRNGFADEAFKRQAISVLDDASDDVPLAFDCADDGTLAGIAAPACSTFLVPMPVFVRTANVGFVNFYNTSELTNVLDERDADLVAHKPSSFVGTKAHISEDLKSAHSLFADQHQVNDAIPIFEWFIRVLKDCAGQMGEAIAVRRALFALPMMAGSQGVDLGIAAARADDGFGPAARNQIVDAIFFGLKQRIELRCAQLMDGLRVASHDGISNLWEVLA
jgi:hypothetical protein